VKTLALDFRRPPDLEAANPPEARGLPRDGGRLLVSAGDRHEHARFLDLPAFVPPGSVLVVNRSATLPAALPARGAPGSFQLNMSTDFGRGLWIAEPRWGPSRPGPLTLNPGEGVEVAGLDARLVAPYPGLPRLWFLRIEGDLYRRMAEVGRPIRYGYLAPPHPPISAYQTIFSSQAGSAEMPSAARPFTPRVLAGLRARGVHITSIVLHTGVSSLEVETEELEDHPLYAEPFVVPAETATLIERARAERRLVLAVGTSVVRALESARESTGRVRPTAGFTRRYIHPGNPVGVVDGLLTGLHDPRSSHLAMLLAVAGPETVRNGYEEAVRERYFWHEFGDSHLLFTPSAASKRAQFIAPRHRVLAPL